MSLNVYNNPTATINSRYTFDTLITTKDVKQYCNLNANVQDALIIPSIITATDTKIIPVISKQLYQELINELILVNMNPNNLPDGTTLPNNFNYKELYQEILKPLVWWSYSLLIPNIGIKVDEKGIMLNDSDFSENGGLNLIREAETRARKTAEYYTEQLNCYVKEVTKKREDSQALESDQSLVSGFFNGLYFPKKHKRCTDCK